ncbi:hypothetical protein J4214_05025 [Candidatus Woesearchaeota archaeon]|nr:hypothetical protein [Candidatus Woesearchaeota archaeon]
MEKNNIPSLEYLTNANADEIVEHISNLSLSEILIVGAGPLKGTQRSRSEIKFFNKLYLEKLASLHTQQKDILKVILPEQYPKLNILSHPISNYLDKYLFLLNLPQLKQYRDNLESNIVDDIKNYEEMIPLYFQLSESRSHPKKKWIDNLRSTSVNLNYMLVTQGYSTDSINSTIICKKTKSPDRTALKIPYKMIDIGRERKRQSNGKNNKYILSDGIIRDIVGLQFICPDKESVVSLKEYFFQHDDIMVLRMDDYYNDHISEYNAYHIDALWNPKNQNEKKLMNPNDSIEIIIMTQIDFLKSNFGVTSYWNRFNAQKKGIVGKYLQHGRLCISKFSQEEENFRDITEERILDIIQCKTC